MAERIEIETRSLGRDRETIQSHTEGLRNRIQSMAEQMESLCSMWEGPAKESFIAQFQSDYEFMQEFLKEMDKYVQAMNFAENEYDKCESDVAQVIAAIRI